MKTINELHKDNKCIIVGNAWDPMSALIMEQQGFDLIGTTSWGVANSLGYQDGEIISFDEYLKVIKNILSVISIPLSVDVESGFSVNKEKIIDNVLTLAKLGCSGVNLEDSTKEYQLKPKQEFSELLKDLRGVLDNANFQNFFINARTDTYIALQEHQLEETLERVALYEKNGANGIFVPLMSEKNDIKSLLSRTTLPLNIMSLPNITDIEELKEIGVRKYSFGNAMSDAIISTIEKFSKSILETKNTKELYSHDNLRTKFMN